MYTMENKSFDIIYNGIDPSRLIKQFDNNEINENNLALKSPKRILVDISTDTFIKIIFKDDTNYYLFLNYVNLLDFYLNYYGNLDIVDNNLQPFHGDEKVELFFKGGNVMNYHFSKIVTDIRLKEIFSTYFKKSDFDFSVNIYTNKDNRFNLMKKYIYYWIIKFLKNTTDVFNNYLSDILNEKKINEIVNSEILTNFKNPDNDEKFLAIYDTIKDLIDVPRFEIFRQIINEYIKIYGIKSDIPKINSIMIIDKYMKIDFSGSIIGFKPKNLSLYQLKYTNYIINNFNELIENYNKYVIRLLVQVYYEFYENSKYYAILLYPYYKYLIMPIIKHEVEYNNLIDNLLIYNFSIIKLNNFYTKEKILELSKTISKLLHELKDVYYDINNENPPAFNESTNSDAFNKYTVNSSTPVITIYPRADFITYNDFKTNNGTVIIEYGHNYQDINIIKNINNINTITEINNNIHYISVNYLIKNVLGNRQILDFDLLRIKFNMVAINSISKNGQIEPIFKIPSEFIDISITSIYSDSYHEDNEIFILRINIEGIILPDIPVKSHSYVYFIEDLIRILFTDGNFFPWMKNKYEKRLKRLLLLIYIYDTKHQTMFLNDIYQIVMIIKYNLTYPTEKQICLNQFSLSPVFLSSYKEFTNFFDLLYIDKKYSLIKQPIKMLLIMSEIFKVDNSLEIINHFRKYIKLSPLIDINNLQKEFIKFLDEIINTYNDINL